MAIAIGLMVDPNATFPFGYTLISKDGAADGTGTITKVNFSIDTEVENFTVAIFEEVSPGFFTARSSQNLGTKAVGLHENVEVDLAVVTGDFIGCYFSAGNLDHRSSGGEGQVYLADDQTSCNNAEFAVADEDAGTCLSGTGTSSSAPTGGGIAIQSIMQGLI